ncbi:ubiquitin-like-conjugating enzyme ATG10 isoform X2 [Archocentrus centrarchus]|uniref:ubiquitin-like-conjugating enzyme ATG10 isoform X2 n=1 Tax=Archocentrus centrarchus TaxID=63155 RepID=UPI0011EA01FA|nr:ubiquitin-like-conjugating enzyme ATG10 isoform X2 [Archocentrus centrarchus]
MSRCALDEQAFRCCCQLLLQQSEQLRDGWSWEQVQGSEEGYLKKTVLRSVVADSSPALKQKGAASDSESRVSTHSILEPQREQSRQPVLAACFHADGTDEDDDAVCTLSEGSSRVLQYEYHVLYSCSYSAPVLYFRAFTLEGRSLTLEEVWGSVHPNFKHRLQNSPLNTITQQEHPLLGQPFFMLHPCRTEEFLRPVLQGPQEQHRPVNYVLSWLSVVGPVVGLDVPLKYCTLLQT